MSSRAAILLAALVAGVTGLTLGAALAPRWQEAPPAAPFRQGQASPPTAAAAPEQQPAPQLHPEPSPAAPAPDSERPRVIARQPLPEPYATLIDQTELDLTGDGVDEIVELYAAADRDDRGRLMWDDGQRWMLLVHDGDRQEGYVLFDDFVQLGRLSFWAIKTVEPPNALILEIAAGAGVRVWKVSYDDERDVFVERESVSASGNVLHRTRDELE